MRKMITILMLLGLVRCVAIAETAGSVHVVIVQGINKDADEKLAKARGTILFRHALQKEFGVPAQQITTLTPKDSVAVLPDTIESTSENIVNVLAKKSTEVKPEDRFVFYYIGQANVVKKDLLLNLPGADMTHEQLAKCLKDIKAKQTLVILDCPCAGLAIKSLVSPSTLIVAAAGADQPYSTRFSEYFVPALTDRASDLDKNKRVSILEAFQSASKQLDAFYEERDLIKTENPLLEDDGDAVASQRPWAWAKSGNDGEVASMFYLDNVDPKDNK